MKGKVMTPKRKVKKAAWARPSSYGIVYSFEMKRTPSDSALMSRDDFECLLGRKLKAGEVIKFQLVEVK